MKDTSEEARYIVHMFLLVSWFVAFEGRESTSENKNIYRYVLFDCSYCI